MHDAAFMGAGCPSRVGRPWPLRALQRNGAPSTTDRFFRFRPPASERSLFRLAKAEEEAIGLAADGGIKHGLAVVVLRIGQQWAFRLQ